MGEVFVKLQHFDINSFVFCFKPNKVWNDDFKKFSKVLDLSERDLSQELNSRDNRTAKEKAEL